MQDKEVEAKKESTRKIYRLGEEFPLFDSNNFPIPDLSFWTISKFDLDVAGLLKLPFRIQTSFKINMNPGSAIDIITTGNPEKGYIIDERDFHLDQRKKKESEIRASGWKPDLTENPIQIGLKTVRHYSYETAGVYKLGSFDGIHIPERFWYLITGLVLTLTIPASEKNPTQVFEAKNIGPSGGGVVWFNSFYPADFGPLAKRVHFGWREAGCKLNLPNDPSILQQIFAKIDLIEDQNDSQTTDNLPEPPQPQLHIPPLGVRRKN